MPNYDLAIKKPFTSFKKLIIGILLSIVPIVNWISLGYILECSGLGKNKTQNLPEWKDWKYLFVKGFLATIIQIIYYIPALIVFIIFGTFVFYRLMIEALELKQELMSATNIESLLLLIPKLMPYISKFLPVLIISALLGILATYIIPIAILNYLKNNRFRSAFNSLVLKKSFTGKYFIVWFVVALLIFIVGSILSYVPVLGDAITLFVMGVFSFTLFGQVYLELESKEILKKKIKRK